MLTASHSVPNLTLFPQKPLQEPIVSCALGKLYNKDAILEYLLDKSVYGEGEEVCGHIKSLKVCAEPNFISMSLTLLCRMLSS